MIAPDSMPGAASAASVPAVRRNIQAGQEAPVLWLGRKCHESKNNDLCTKISAIASAVFFTISIAFITFAHPIIGAAFIGLGTYSGMTAYRNWSADNHLEVALKTLTGKSNLDDLPVMPWSIDPKTRKLKIFTQKDMAENVMALKEGNKTIAVAIKYYNPNYDSIVAKKADLIQVFSFKNKLESFSNSSVYVPGPLEVVAKLSIK